jgi:hypothetical protein
MSFVMVGLAAVSLGAGIAGKVSANKKAKKHKRKAKKHKQRMKEFEANRQPVINQADEIRSMKEELFNPAANLPVATQAAEQQMAQTDQALANTLDTIRSTGSGAGGATALAQAAAQSKAKVSASIQQQEASNARAAAQGEAALMKQKQSLDKAALQEEGAAWARQEDRDIVQLNRMQSGMEAEREAAMQQQAAGDQALMSGLGATGSALSEVDFTGQP